MTDAANIAVIVGCINLAATLLGGGIFIGTLTTRLGRVEKDVHETKGLVTSAAVEADRLRRAEDDIQNLENTVEGLRRGSGWINDAKARTVDRKY